MNDPERPWLRSYDPWVPPDVEIPPITLADRFQEIHARFAPRPALHFFGSTLTYDRLMEASRRFAKVLQDEGLSPGEVVAIQLPNIPQYMIAQVGAILAGCPTSGLSPLLSPREVAHQLRDCRARVLVTLDALLGRRIAPVAEELPDLHTVLVTRVLEAAPFGVRLAGRLLRKVPRGKIVPLKGKRVHPFSQVLRVEGEPQRPGTTPEDPCLIQYTGGTTGVPKGAVLTHQNLVANLTQMDTWSRIQWGEEVILSGFPFFHLAGLTLGLFALATGGALVLIADPRNTRQIIREMARHRPTILVNVPSLYMMLLSDPGFRRLDFSSLRFCISGAAPFPAESIRALEAVVGIGKVVEVYGMTETSPIITMNPREGKKKIGTVGLPVPNTYVRLMDLEEGLRPVAMGEEGEIAVRGPQVMKEYHQNPHETRLALREMDGHCWLFTGDVARMDEEGYFTIVDRTKDMLNVSGFKVFSREVEEMLQEHPAIVLCAVIGVPHPERPGSEQVKLVVQPESTARQRGEEALREEILAFARERLSPYKVPKVIVFRDALPLTAVGKVDKKALRKAEGLGNT